MFSKWVIGCMIASSVWVYLTILSKGILDDPPDSIAWLLKIGNNDWEENTMRTITHGLPLREVLEKLGNPDQITEPHVGANIQHLYYTNPHDRSRVVVVTIGMDGNVMNISAGPRAKAEAKPEE